CTPSCAPRTSSGAVRRLRAPGRKPRPWQDGRSGGRECSRRTRPFSWRGRGGGAPRPLLPRPRCARSRPTPGKARARPQRKAKAADTPTFTPRAIKSYPATSTGRRLALARWIVHRDNPLAARVAVNHVWLRHFGQALVNPAFDFGRNGQVPTHPELLDWLAV